jgi:hypothetical protein
MRRAPALALLLAFSGASAAEAGEAARVVNASRPTRCAEEDNIYVKLIGAGLSRLSIEARHPAYAATLRQDSTAPDFTACDMSHDPSYAFTPKHVVLYEDAEYRLVGHTFATFWRKDAADFRVGATVTHDLHLVQLLRGVEGRRIEILVVYPADGYWRLKPLPPPGVPDTAYGSSFLIGPIEEGSRPYVSLSAIEFVPAQVAFRLWFRDGTGSLRVTEASPERTRLEIALPPARGETPFAALRSMFVSPAIADTAAARLTLADDRNETLPIIDLTTVEALDATFLRSTPSRHNTSAPDLRFGDFAR